MKVLLITNLAPKFAGNQSLTRTLNGLAEAGHCVHVLSIRAPVETPPAYDLHPNVYLHYKRMMPRVVRPMWIRLRRMLFAIERIASRRRSSALNRSAAELNPLVGVDHFVPHTPESRVLRILASTAWVVYQFVGVLHGLRMTFKYKIDLFYGYEESGAPVAFLLAKVFGRPVVTRFQGSYMYAAMSSPRWWLSPLYLESALALKLPVDLVIMGNDGRRGPDALRKLRVPPDRVLALTNGVDFGWNALPSASSTAREELSVDPNCHILMTVSNLIYVKRVDRVVTALAAVLRELPDTVLVIVGGGGQREPLEQLAKRLNVYEHVRLVGAVSHPEVRRYLQLADAFISIYEQTNRVNPLFEAMVCGRAIVTLDDGSVSDLIVHGETGMLVDPARVEEQLPETIISLLGDPALRMRLGDGARRMAREKLMSVEERMRVEVEALEKLVLKRSNVSETQGR